VPLKSPTSTSRTERSRHKIHHPEAVGPPEELAADLEAWVSAERRAEELEQSYAEFLDDLAKRNRAFDDIRHDLKLWKERAEAASAAVKNAAHTHRCGAKLDGFEVQFTDPETMTWDTRLAQVPGFLDIPGVIKSWKLNKDAVEAAVAAGVIPPIGEYVIKKKTTTAGAVTLKRPS